jgi:hypothetical protein
MLSRRNETLQDEGEQRPADIRRVNTKWSGNITGGVERSVRSPDTHQHLEQEWFVPVPTEELLDARRRGDILPWHRSTIIVFALLRCPRHDSTSRRSLRGSVLGRRLHVPRDQLAHDAMWGKTTSNDVQRSFLLTAILHQAVARERPERATHSGWGRVQCPGEIIYVVEPGRRKPEPLQEPKVDRVG